MLRRQCSHSFIDLVAFWSLLCQKYQTILELESSSCVTRASIQLAKDYKWAFQASLASPNVRLTGSVANLPRSWRPKKLSMEARAFVDQQMRRNDETTSTKIRKKLAKRGILVSWSTVRRLRKQKIYYYSRIWWQWSEQAYVLSFLVENQTWSLYSWKVKRVFLILCIPNLTPAEDLSSISWMLYEW